MNALVQFRIKALTLAAPGIALIASAGCVGRRSVNLPVAVASTMGAFIGNEACAKCHRRECQGYSQTNHARTLRRMTPDDLGPQAPPTGPLPNTNCVLERTGNKYEVSVSTTGERKTLDYALGSGKTGMTFISVEDKTALTEMRMSYFPSRHAWFITPGQEEMARNPELIGRNHGNKRQCILCHAVSIPPDSLHPDPKLMGVGCETCHGPARAHVEALTHGSHGPPMEKLAGANGDRINAICGSCHRTVEDVFAMPAQNQNSARFPVFGLASSRCYQASGAALTCITCHNPHQNAGTDAGKYERVCLQCHSKGDKAPPGSVKLTGIRGRVCPVNARAGCISCHMPKRRVFNVAKVPTTMSDHLIKVHK